MGRELKRVPMDFAWPENKVWKGFINPHHDKSKECRSCNGRGETIASQRLGDLVSLLMLSGDDAARGRCHPYFDEAPLHSTRGKVCGKDMIDLTSALSGRSPSGMGYDMGGKWAARKKIIAAAQLPEQWGICQSCGGEGELWDSPDDKKLYEEWEPTEPPTGGGFQIWETVSEGSPISPVFDTPEALADHMAGTAYGADKGSSREAWLRFINGPGWAPSMIIDARGIHVGPNAIPETQEDPQ